MLLSPIMARPMVVLPLPDSPTKEKVSPLLMKKFAFLTATKRFLPSPKEISKSFTSTNFFGAVCCVVVFTVCDIIPSYYYLKLSSINLKILTY